MVTSSSRKQQPQELHITHGVTPELGRLLYQLIKNQETIMADLSSIKNSVEGLTSVVDSAVQLLGSLADQIRNAGTDQAALEDLAASIEAQRQELAEAIAANTPAENA